MTGSVAAAGPEAAAGEEPMQPQQQPEAAQGGAQRQQQQQQQPPTPTAPETALALKSLTAAGAALAFVPGGDKIWVCSPDAEILVRAPIGLTL